VDDFHLYEVPQSVLSAESIVWKMRTRKSELLDYASEADLVNFVNIFLTNFINAMGLDLKLHSELGIQHITPDIAVITLGNRLVGVVEVKRPGAQNADSILEQATVLGELLDQMLLVGRFYACGPVIGILTTLKEWRFAWFPEDNEHFCEDHSDFRASSTLFTPQKESTSMQDEAKRSPSGTTPSHANPQCHRIMEEKETEDSSSIALRDYETR
jgi:hypothetical protein